MKLGKRSLVFLLSAEMVDNRSELPYVWVGTNCKFCPDSQLYIVQGNRAQMYNGECCQGDSPDWMKKDSITITAV
jgi:hypothetical protein